MKFIFIKKSWLYLTIVFVCTLIGAFLYFNGDHKSVTTVNPFDEELEFHMITTEFKTTTPDGEEIESYRWDPGTIYLPKGEDIMLRIYGINGHEHPFHIDGTDINGMIRKGEETIVQVNFEEEGIYRLICSTHSSHEHHVPMIAYLVVK
ncbi:hypothetical protein [Bacillus sp. JCM 19034]|uniref:hypothetical protein n=1 Tax=Bacillus sp. JCM 19034 TaxID=1481928 RepID=UPI0007847C4D|nr:hypothetical protein [Bacillus sp. JCM 19034]